MEGISKIGGWDTNSSSTFLGVYLTPAEEIPASTTAAEREEILSRNRSRPIMYEQEVIIIMHDCLAYTYIYVNCKLHES